MAHGNHQAQDRVSKRVLCLRNDPIHGLHSLPDTRQQGRFRSRQDLPDAHSRCTGLPREGRMDAHHLAPCIQPDQIAQLRQVFSGFFGDAAKAFDCIARLCQLARGTLQGLTLPRQANAQVLVGISTIVFQRAACGRDFLHAQIRHGRQDCQHEQQHRQQRPQAGKPVLAMLRQAIPPSAETERPTGLWRLIHNCKCDEWEMKDSIFPFSFLRRPHMQTSCYPANNTIRYTAKK